MQFCWSAAIPNVPQGVRACLHSLSQGETPTSQSLPIFFYYFNSCCNQFLTLSQTLNQEMILNTNLIDQRVQPTIEKVEAQETGISDSQQNMLGPNKNTTQVCGIKAETQELKIKYEKKKNRRNRQNDSDEDSYVPDDFLQKSMCLSARRQSKNIPKNYGRAIIIFIQKNEAYVRRVLRHLGIKFHDFMKSVKKGKQKLKSIQGLKSLWMQEENQYAKAYRIISHEYLRKHCFSYIFNSRIANFTNHIKYRYRIFDIVKNPRDFTVLKEF